MLPGSAPARPAYWHLAFDASQLQPAFPHLGGFTAVDAQLTRFVADVVCQGGPGQEATCPVTVVVSWRPGDRTNGRPLGPAVGLATVKADVPVGGKQAVTIDVPTSKLRDVVARRHVIAIVQTVLVNEQGQEVAGDTYYGIGGAFADCPGPVYAPFSGGAVQESHRVNGHAQRSSILTGDLAEGVPMVVGAHAITFTESGVTYTLAPHAVFMRTCWSVGAVRGGRWFPTVELDSGSVHARGKPTGAQLAVSIGTPEGALGSRSQERVDLVVSRDPKREVSTMRVKVGATTQVTPRSSPTRSPCTNGQALTVDHAGRIHRI
jgi:hypothetical protein